MERRNSTVDESPDKDSLMTPTSPDKESILFNASPVKFDDSIMNDGIEI
jgi:hypothetical protein